MKIILIDDKNIGLDQIKQSLSECGIRDDACQLDWYDSFAAYSTAKPTEVDITFLDYHLDIDGIYSTRIIKDINTKYLIGFSNSQKGCDRIATKAIESGKFEPSNVFAILKQPANTPNQLLTEVVGRLLKAIC